MREQQGQQAQNWNKLLGLSRYYGWNLEDMATLTATDRWVPILIRFAV
jgi:hypothetical protein